MLKQVSVDYMKSFKKLYRMSVIHLNENYNFPPLKHYFDFTAFIKTLY